MSATARKSGFIVLVFRIPAKQTAGRAALWRMLKRAGPIHLRQSVWVFLDTSHVRREIAPILARITDSEGEFHLLPVEDLDADEVAKLVRRIGVAQRSILEQS